MRDGGRRSRPWLAYISLLHCKMNSGFNYGRSRQSERKQHVTPAAAESRERKKRYRTSQDIQHIQDPAAVGRNGCHNYGILCCLTSISWLFCARRSDTLFMPLCGRREWNWNWNWNWIHFRKEICAWNYSKVPPTWPKWQSNIFTSGLVGKTI